MDSRRSLLRQVGIQVGKIPHAECRFANHELPESEIFHRRRAGISAQITDARDEERIPAWAQTERIELTLVDARE